MTEFTPGPRFIVSLQEGILLTADQLEKVTASCGTPSASTPSTSANLLRARRMVTSRNLSIRK